MRFIINLVIGFLAWMALSVIWVVGSVVVCATIGQTYDTATSVGAVGIVAIMIAIAQVDWAKMIMGSEEKK